MTELMLCSAGKQSDLDDPRMAAELKLDGTYIRATKKEERIDVYGRPRSAGLPVYTDRLPDLTEALQVIPGDFQMLGEAVVYDEKGRSWFEGSQRRCSTQTPAKIAEYKCKYPIMMLAFDIIELDGKDLTGHSYESRKQILFDLLEETPQKRVIPLPHIIENKREFYQQAVNRGEEGVVLKRLGSTYSPGKSRDWLKVKKWDEERLKVVGWTEGTGKYANEFGALILAKLMDDGTLVYRGKVGTGFKESERRQITKLLKKHITDRKTVITDEDYIPVDIPLEVTVKFFEETKNYVLRMPSLLKDAFGKNMIHYESTINGIPQLTKNQISLDDLMRKLREEN